MFRPLPQGQGGVSGVPPPYPDAYGVKPGHGNVVAASRPGFPGSSPPSWPLLDRRRRIRRSHGADYQIIEWQPRNPAQLATLKRIGVTAAAVIADRDGTGTPLAVQTAPLRQAGLRWYIENIATDFYAPTIAGRRASR